MEDIDLSSAARLVGDPTRGAILRALLDGRAMTGRELSRVCGVSASTVSEHVARLLDGGLIETAAQGRHRYVRLAGPEVAQTLESLAFISAAQPATTLRMSSAAQALRPARMCYDHLAGQLGVRISDHLHLHGHLEVDVNGLNLTSSGIEWFERIGIETGLSSGQAKRPRVRSCLDWTERRPHLAGTLPAALANHMLAEDWVRRRGPGQRGLTITPDGRRHLDTLLGTNAP